jgi:glucose-6-phosphate 1-dehydrogenase
MHVHPEEGMDLTIQAKHPGPRLCMGPMTLHFHYSELAKSTEVTEAYARLLLDAMLGDSTLFMRCDRIRAGWELFTPVLQLWKNDPGQIPLYHYSAGSDGPAEAARLLLRDDREWRLIKP